MTTSPPTPSNPFEQMMMLSLQLLEKGQYAEALAKAKEVHEGARAYLGENHPYTILPLFQMARAKRLLGDLTGAEQSISRADSMFQAAGETSSYEYGEILNEFGMIVMTCGRHTEAEPLFRRALEILRATQGENHQTTISLLSNLGFLLRESGRFDEAEELTLGAMENVRKQVGEEHIMYGILLDHLAQLHMARGNYQKAEPLLNQAVEIKKKHQGENHPDVALVIANLGMVYLLLGNPLKAVFCLGMAGNTLRTALGDKNPYLASILSNMAMARSHLGDRAGAEQMIREALEIQKETLGENHPQYAASLNMLAILLRVDGRTAEAVSLAKQAAKVNTKTIGTQHHTYALTLSNLAAAHLSEGRAEEAEAVLRQALDLARQQLGEDHRDVAYCRMELASVCVFLGRFDEAFELLQQGIRAEEMFIGQVFSMASESHRLFALPQVELTRAVYLSFLADATLRSKGIGSAAVLQEAAKAGCDLMLRRKALILEAMGVQREAVLGGRHPELRPMFEELIQVRAELGRRLQARPMPGEEEAHQLGITEVAGRREWLESFLARQVPEMDMRQRMRSANREAVAAALPPDSVLVEFVRFVQFDAGKPPWGQQPDKQRYAAFVLPAGRPDDITHIDLGDAAVIDAQIAAYRAGIELQGSRSRGRDLRRLTQQPKVQAGDGWALRSSVFDPLLPHLLGRTRLLLACEGDLNLVPFEGLPISQGRFLLDRFRISYVSCGRDVLHFGAPIEGQAEPPLVVSDPDFNCGGGSGDPFALLPGTGLEGRLVAGLLSQSRLWTGAGATKGRFRRECRSPGILHLATHGYFLRAEEAAAQGREAAANHPYLKTGLTLAGANAGWRGQAGSGDVEDGLLTAEDVCCLDLSATQLAVLSACETGVGDVLPGEGVFGLRRAFVQAGVKTLVMSLWQVDDLATVVFMDRFYTNVLKQTLPRDEALREAQRYTRDATVGQLRGRWLTKRIVEVLAANRPLIGESLGEMSRQPDEHRPFAQPYYWAAFICQGEPAPLPK